MAGTVVKAGYRRSVDLARFLAAFGIVWDHARAPYADIGYTALGLFLVLTSYLAMGSFERSDGKAFWWARAQRIALPWLVWCAFYRVVYEVVTKEPHGLLDEPWSLLIGPFIHLWFLPFVMVWLVVIPTISRYIDRVERLYIASALLVILSIPLGLLHAKMDPLGWFYDIGEFPLPFPQWFFSLKLFLFGAILAAGKRLGVVWPVFAAAAMVSAVLYFRVPEFASVQMILVAVIFEAIWRINIKGTWPTWLAGFAFGIYLLHPACMLVAYKLFGPDVDRTLAALFTFALAWGLTAILQRIPLAQRFI
jgi:surface polysaccharide O-acyltransferase-like enzyme